MEDLIKTIKEELWVGRTINRALMRTIGECLQAIEAKSENDETKEEVE